jgi:uncharacterized membrane protein YhhN
MRAEAIWIVLAALWLVAAGVALHQHDPRQALVAVIAAICFFLAGLYFRAKRERRSS